MPQYLVHRQIHEVPVIRLLCILQIHLNDLIALLDSLCIVLQPLRSQLLKLRHKNQEATKPHLVPSVYQQFRYLLHRKIHPCHFYNFTSLRHLQSKKLIALTILPWSRLKEPHEYPSLLIIAQRHHILDDFLCCGHDYFLLYAIQQRSV